MHDLAAEIAYELENFSKEVEDIVSEEIETVGKEMAKELKEVSPKRTGGYAKGWRIKRESKHKIIVQNSKKPYLTHLLEHGHAKRNGGRVRAIPHIKPTETKYQEKLAENIKRRIGQ